MTTPSGDLTMAFRTAKLHSKQAHLAVLNDCYIWWVPRMNTFHGSMHIFLHFLSFTSHNGRQ
jgi:hypothetical protein